MKEEGEKKESIKEEPKPPARNAAYEGVIADQQEKNRVLAQKNKEMEERLAKLEAGPPKDSKEKAKEYWEDPVSATEKMINEALVRTMEPLTKQVAESSNDSKLDKIKTRLRNENPAYADVLDRAGAHVDTVVNASGMEPSYETVRMAIIGVRGAAAMKMLDGISFDGESTTKQDDETNQGNDNMTTPPHLRPSAPRAPRKKEENKVTMDDLTENERRCCRESKMTAEQYINMRDATALEVTSIVLPGEEKS